MNAVPTGMAAVDVSETSYAGRRVVLTRESGKNGDMMERLTRRGIECVEMPLIETAVGADAPSLPSALNDPEGWTWVCITSPEAAAVFLRGWEQAGQPDVAIATVGKGTAKVLKPAYDAGKLRARTFTPSKANAETLVAELPLDADDASAPAAPRVLYPASAKAASTLQDGLAKRGAIVTRLNTYSTEKVTAVDEDVLTRAKTADVVTFGSPSAVKAWVSLSGFDSDTPAETHPAYACIGGTSAKACDAVGIPNVMFAENPGLDGWELVVCNAFDGARERSGAGGGDRTQSID
jgi:uroporphyrinogen-III synthase